MHTLCIRFIGALMLAAVAGKASAHVGPLDPSFGDGGMRNYGFQPINSSAQDMASVACSSADGVLTVTGFASGDNRIVTARLLPDGSYDQSFGSGGRVSVTLPGSYNHFIPGLCQSDGHMVMARALTAGNGEQDLQIVRVLKTTGALDPGFGNGGIVHVDLDQHTAGLGTAEMPLGVNALANGDIAISGMATLGNDAMRGFVVVLSGGGGVNAVRVLDNVRAGPAATVVDTPDGKLWVFGTNTRVSGAYRAVLNRQSLAWEGVLEHVASSAGVLQLSQGRSVDASTVVIAATYTVGNSINSTPQLIVFRAGQVSALALPQAWLDNTSMFVSRQPGRRGVTVLPGRRVLYGGEAHPVDNSSIDSGIYLGMAHIGRQPSEDRIEPRFGSGGGAIAAFRSAQPACAGVTARHTYSRMTLWLGRPVLVGSAMQLCSGGTEGSDYLVSRVLPDYIFADGLQ